MMQLMSLTTAKMYSYGIRVGLHIGLLFWFWTHSPSAVQLNTMLWEIK